MKVHGDNLKQKEESPKYSREESKKLLKEIRPAYDEWAAANDALIGPTKDASPADAEIIAKRIELFSRYKDLIDKKEYAEEFDSRSNLHSSVLEEFVYYLFRDLITSLSKQALIGKSQTFKDIFFLPPNYAEMLLVPHSRVEEKDHDFAIGVTINVRLKCAGQTTEETHDIRIPAVAIECKTYLDKTMLEGASTAAEQLKTRNPNAIYIIVSEWLKLSEDVNLKKFKVDQMYVLRKQKNTDREYRLRPGYDKKPVYLDVVLHLYETVRKHLFADWQGGVGHGLERGYLLE